MKKKDINISRSFEMMTPTGLHYWDKISVGADLEEGDTVEECAQILKDDVLKFQNKAIAENESSGTKQTNKWTKPEVSMIEELEACTFLGDKKSGLLSYAIAYKTDDEKKVYDRKFKELSNK